MLHVRDPRALPALAAQVFACLAACRSEPATQIVVVIDTDIPSATMDGFATRVLDGDERVVSEERFTLGKDAPGVRLPADFAIGPKGGDARRTVRVEVDALAGDEVLFGTHAVTSFRAERSLRLDMFLASRCLDEADACAPDERCTAQGCVPATIDPADLPGFDGAEADGGAALAPWAATFESEGVIVPAIAFGPDGDLYVLAGYTAPLTFDGWQAPDGDGMGLLLVRFDPEGRVVWRVAYPGGSGLALSNLAITSGGAELQVIGAYGQGVVDLGGGPLEARDLVTAFRTRYDAATGDNLGTALFRGTATSTLTGIAVDPDGAVALVGSFGQELTYGPVGTVASGEGDLNDVLMIFEPDGSYRCGVTLGAAPGAISQPVGVAFDEGRPVVTGSFQGDLVIGTLPARSDEIDSWVVRFTEECAVDEPSLDLIGGAGIQVPTGVAIAGEDVVVVGSADRGLSVGGVEVPTRGGGADIMLVRQTPRGAVGWALGGLQPENSAAVIEGTRSGHVLLTAQLTGGPVDLAGLEVDVPASGEGAVLEVDPQGIGVSVREFRSDLGATLRGMARSALTGRVAVVGYSTGPTDMGGELTVDCGSRSAFIYVFGAEGP